jgi:hypothetical protein
MKKLLLAVVSVTVVVLGGGFGYLAIRKPVMAPPSNIRVEMTPERIARGKYIFEAGADCGGCHSERDWSRFTAPVVAGGAAKGVTFPPELGLPGTVIAPNLTPDPETGLGEWTDGEKIRAIREGISRDGRALFSMMPYTYFRSMSDDDVQALVAYLNSLPPVKNKLPRTKLDFPVGLFMAGLPRPVSGPVAAPGKSDTIRYGEYLVNRMVCKDCHTQMERGELKEELAFAGGREFRIGKFLVNAANITPDVETGFGGWSEDRFVKTFRDYANFAQGSPLPPATQANFTLMPWPVLSQTPEEDLKAIYAYLKTLKPIRNPVTKHPELPGT